MQVLLASDQGNKAQAPQARSFLLDEPYPFVKPANRFLVGALLFLNHCDFDLYGNVRMQLQGDVILT